MESGTHAINLRLPVLVHQELKQLAQQQERSVSWLINKILAAEVQRKQDVRDEPAAV